MLKCSLRRSQDHRPAQAVSRDAVRRSYDPAEVSGSWQPRAGCRLAEALSPGEMDRGPIRSPNRRRW
jgi:hypothetical protein